MIFLIKTLEIENEIGTSNDCTPDFSCGCDDLTCACDDLNCACDDMCVVD